MIVQKYKQSKFYEVGRIVTAINKKPSESKFSSTNKKPPKEIHPPKPPQSSSGSKSSTNGYSDRHYPS